MRGRDKWKTREKKKRWKKERKKGKKAAEKCITFEPFKDSKIRKAECYYH
jgi:hypothetical protein